MDTLTAMTARRKVGVVDTCKLDFGEYGYFY